jgi:hypothetical protein
MKRQPKCCPLGCVIVFFFVLWGCSTALPKGTYRGYYGVEPAESELATLDLGTAAQAIIDDMYLVTSQNYRTVKLIAGMHRIKWVSSYVDFGVTSKINFEAGHTYTFFQDWRAGYGYKGHYMWIEDMTTGKIVYGEKKP